MNKAAKREIITRLLIPVLIIIASIIYGMFNKGSKKEDLVLQTNVEGQLLIDYLDVGQGDSTLIRKGDFTMLIDAGENEQGKDLVKRLKKMGVNELDILVGTHPDSDHIGGLDDVLNGLKVDTVYMPPTAKKTKTVVDVNKALKKCGKQAQMPELAKEYRYDENVLIRFLSPNKQYEDSNNNSIVVQLAYGKSRFLFMGDAEDIAEKDILKKNYDLECDVLKVGHHGSYTATGKKFLQKADPTYAVISCGKDNSYGHPHQETLAKLEDEDVQIYRTDTMGTIHAESDGKNVVLSTEKSYK